MHLLNPIARWIQGYFNHFASTVVHAIVDKTTIKISLKYTVFVKAKNYTNGTLLKSWSSWDQHPEILFDSE